MLDITNFGPMLIGGCRPFFVLRFMLGQVRGQVPGREGVFGDEGGLVAFGDFVSYYLS